MAMILINSVAVIFMLTIACSCINIGSCRMFDSQMDIESVDLSYICERQNDLENNLTELSILNLGNVHNDFKTLLHLNLTSENLDQEHENISRIGKDYITSNDDDMKTYEAYLIDQQLIRTMYKDFKTFHLVDYVIENVTEKSDYKIFSDAQTLFENKLSALLFQNNELNNKLSQLNDTLKQMNQDKERNFTETLEISKKYNESLITLITREEHFQILQWQGINMETEKKTLEFNITDLLKKENTQEEQFNAINKQYQLDLTNEQRKINISKEIIFRISQRNFVERADVLKTFISIMESNDDNVSDNLLKKRRQLFENQTVIVDDLRKLFDEIALMSDSQFSNKYFCNKKISFYNSTICSLLIESLNTYGIDLSRSNLVYLPTDIFTGFENITELDLSYNRLYHLESSTFDNLSNLQVLWLNNNNLTSFSRDIFEGLEKLEQLYVNQNQLSSLQSGTFNNLLNLKTLQINKNHLTFLPKDIFTGLKNLEELSISGNQINYLEPSTFINLSNLQMLDLFNNNLTTDSKNVLKNKYNFKTFSL